MDDPLKNHSLVRHVTVQNLLACCNDAMAIEPSLLPAQLHGTVYKQQFVKLTACIRLIKCKLRTHLFTLCFNN